MTYAELKKTKTYRKAEDISLCVNGEEPIDEMYYPYRKVRKANFFRGWMDSTKMLINC